MDDGNVLGPLLGAGLHPWAKSLTWMATEYSIVKSPLTCCFSEPLGPFLCDCMGTQSVPLAPSNLPRHYMDG